MSRLLILTLTLLGLLAADAQAQSYWFGVPEVEMVVRIRPDASAQIEYAFRFANEPGAHAIDIVDVGMPTDDYDLNTMTAWANGDLGPTIQHSTYVTPGVEIHLGRHTIHAGNEGEVKLRFTHPDLVFNDTTDSDLASFQITPTWFGSQYVTGTTDLKLLIFLPEGVAPDDVLHQGQREFANKAITDEGTAVLFRWERTTFTHAHTVGISFPIASMDRVVRISKWALLVQAAAVQVWWRLELEPITWAMANLGRTVPMVELARANNLFNAAAICFEQFLDDQGFDLILTPTIFRAPEKLGVLALTADPDVMGAAVASFAPLCPLFNQMGAPAMSVPLHWTGPTGTAPQGLPLGMMFGGRCGSEELLFSLAGQLERAQPWSDRYPPVRVG